MYPGHWAKKAPEKPAAIDAFSGEVLTHKSLNDSSNQIAQMLYAKGLRPDDRIAILMENRLIYYPIVWAALRSGMHVTPINYHLTASETGYILKDCGAQALFASASQAETVQGIDFADTSIRLRYVTGGEIAGFKSLEAAMHRHPARPLAKEPRGEYFYYSSGTTGKPKGILKRLSGKPVADGLPNADIFDAFGFTHRSTYLTPAPNYHAAPLGFTVRMQAYGGTTVMMRKFDAEEALKAIEKYKVTHSQWVPTMFVRMLKLPEELRTKYDLSSLKVALHAAAPCPVEIKRKMIDWWGPIIDEYYAASEAVGKTWITTEEWLEHPGSVGQIKAGKVHICDNDGNVQPQGTPGLIYFEEDERSFRYHNDPEKTQATAHPLHQNWTALGDIGYMDNDGYLYLTDRANFTIISGGVNIYPRAVEDALITHPDVVDVAVFGVPNSEMGEEVKAVVQLRPGHSGGKLVEEELISYAKDRIAHYMAPRSVEFTTKMPRLENGKLYKQKLKEQYWKRVDLRQQG